MKKIVAIFFLFALGGTLLPALCSHEQKKVVLFATTEEEQHDHSKELKGKEALEAPVETRFFLVTYIRSRSAYPGLFVLFSDDPFRRNSTPPPDAFC